MDITIRAARPEEYERIGEITAEAYLGDGLLTFGEDDDYLLVLRDVKRRAAEAEVLVAEADGELLGGVTFAPPGSPWADLAREADGEVEFRMLAVSPAGRGRGAGEALVRACIARAGELGASKLLLSTQDAMHGAHRIYERLGFRRTPDRDWEPIPSISLLTYELEL